jgi:hypothetical protein
VCKFIASKTSVGLADNRDDCRQACEASHKLVAGRSGQPFGAALMKGSLYHCLGGYKMSSQAEAQSGNNFFNRSKDEPENWIT